MGRYLGKVMVAGPNPAEGSNTFFAKEAGPRNSFFELLSVLGLSIRLIVSLRAFSVILEIFNPYFLDFSTNSGGNVMLIVS